MLAVETDKPDVFIIKLASFVADIADHESSFLILCIC